MVHQRQGLPLRLEACDHLARVHTRLDNFQRHAPFDRALLLGQKDYAKPAFADLLK
jgi:hypothetical protein